MTMSEYEIFLANDLVDGKCQEVWMHERLKGDTQHVARALAVLIGRFGEKAVVEASRQLNNAKPQPIMLVLDALSDLLV